MCRRVVSCWLGLGLLLLAHAHYGQLRTFRVDHIGVDDGLTQGSVYAMLKDSRGFMWFGTQDGLNRYDGQHFWSYRPAQYTSAEALPASSPPPRRSAIQGINIYGLVEDPAGNLWVGTEAGLNRYDRQRDAFTCYVVKTAGGRPNRTLPFYIDQTALLYLSDAEGLVSFDYRRGRKTVLNAGLKPTREYNLQTSTVRTRAGDVWLHAPQGLIRYNLAERRTYHYFSDHPENQFGAAQAVFSFYIDPQSDVAWIGTATGMFRYNPRTNVVQTFAHLPNAPNSPVYSITADTTGRLWLGTQRNGLLFLDSAGVRFGRISRFTSDPRPLTDYEVSKVYTDNEGITWANVDPDGLAKIVPNTFLFDGLVRKEPADRPPGEPLLSNYVVRGFLEVPGPGSQLWIATEAGINVLDRRSNRVVAHHFTNANRSDLPMTHVARCLYRDALGRVWVGGSKGVFLFRPQTQTFTRYPLTTTLNSLVASNYVRNMIALGADTLLAATEDGIHALDIRRRRWSVRPELRGKNIFCFLWEPLSRRLWVGTYLEGFFCYQLPPVGQPGPWRLVRHGLRGFTVLHLHNDPARQTVWLSTDRGLAAFARPTNRIRLFTTSDGLVNPFVYGVLPDRQNILWMSTNHGLARFDPETTTFKNFDLADGLQGYEFNGNAFLRTTDGTLLFGGVNGLNWFRPEHYQRSETTPAVHIYNLKVNEERFATHQYIGEMRRLELGYHQNTFSLEFAALDYVSNGRNTYQYRLSGYDPDWVQSGRNNYVRYANLPPGTYVFQVRAANKDGHWSRRGHQLTVHIRPPFWRTVPFLLLMVLAGGLLIYGWVRRRENLIRRQQEERLRLSYDIQEQVRKDIARDLHDEIGTRLATLKLYATRLAQMVTDTAETRSLKGHMFGLINDTIGDVRNLLRKLNPQTLEQHGYVAALEELINRINAAGAVQAHLTLDLPPDTRFAPDKELMLYRITQELINNTLKHANAQRVELTVQLQDDWLMLNYTDDGVGFAPDRSRQAAAGRGLGIGNIEARVAMLGGQIRWLGGVGAGTRASIVVPRHRGLSRLRPGEPRPTQTSTTTPSVSG